MRSLPIILAALLVVGCASSKKKEPPPQAIQSAITERLSDYSAAWFAGDAKGVADSFNRTQMDDREFAISLGRLAAAQKELMKEQPNVPAQIAATVQMSEGVPMIALNRPWHYYAYAASHPPASMTRASETAVDVEMMKSSGFALTLSNVQGQWLIEPSSWAKDRPVSVLTDSIRRQLALTTSGTDAIRAKNWDKLKLVLQQMNQQRMVDKISDSTNYEIP